MANRTARNESRRVRLDKGEKKKIERKKMRRGLNGSSKFRNPTWMKDEHAAPMK